MRGELVGQSWRRKGAKRNLGRWRRRRIFVNFVGGEGGGIKKIIMYLVVLLKLRILEARQLSIQFAT